MNKKESRLRRGRRSRIAMLTRGNVRLVVNKSNQHIYAQIISSCGKNVLASSSTLSLDVKKAITNSSNIEAAKIVGKSIAEKAIDVGVKKVAFDRSGFRFHGRVKELANSAREAGLEF